MFYLEGCARHFRKKGPKGTFTPPHSETEGQLSDSFDFCHFASVVLSVMKFSIFFNVFSKYRIGRGC